MNNKLHGCDSLQPEFLANVGTNLITELPFRNNDAMEPPYEIRDDMSNRGIAISNR